MTRTEGSRQFRVKQGRSLSFGLIVAFAGTAGCASGPAVPTYVAPTSGPTATLVVLAAPSPWKPYIYIVRADDNGCPVHDSFEHGGVVVSAEKTLVLNMSAVLDRIVGNEYDRCNFYFKFTPRAGAVYVLAPETGYKFRDKLNPLEHVVGPRPAPYCAAPISERAADNSMTPVPVEQLKQSRNPFRGMNLFKRSCPEFGAFVR